MNEIKATLYKIDGSKEPLILNPKTRLKTLQKLVDGYIEIVFLLSKENEEKELYNQGKDLVINEEGFILDLPPNPWSEFVTKGSNWQGNVFFGNIVLVDGVLP